MTFSLINSAFLAVDEVGDDYLELDPACKALAACEALARLRGRPGYTNAYTEKVDQWVEAHPIVPPTALIEHATAIISRILRENSELRELWEEGDATEWRQSIEDLRQRLLVS
jgi:uncharacterized protein DUF4259